MPHTVLILGSGALKIGQAGEFDYSGSQAIKALKEEGIRTVLINPNIATIQTSEDLADEVYFLPVTPEYVTRVIEKERPDGLLLSFGGQTALNCGIALETSGVLAQYGVNVLGTPVATIEDTEDRKRFVDRLNEIGATSPISIATTSVGAARKAAAKIGYPVMIRVAFALGGRGSGICKTEAELIKRCHEAFSTSRQVLVEEWLGGWKEVEYEVVRDAYDNCVTVCNMENFDPLGIHTGESIVVAPSQTLTNDEYHMLREIAIRVVRHLGVIGECNIQYALDPHSNEYRIIEVNARLSRSSALASKATGYPLAFVAAKLALGYPLHEVKNLITQKTFACFEPALDYVVVKFPRWDLKKFKLVDPRIGSEMKSVGEVMGIGRTFEEALQKAVRMVDIGAEGVTEHPFTYDDLEAALNAPTDTRLFAVATALASDWSVDRIHTYTTIDRWFLHKLARIVACKETLRRGGARLTKTALHNAKKLGFSDRQIATLTGSTEAKIRTKRRSHQITPFVKQIDTLAGEFPAQTNYLYTTYHATEHDVAPSGTGVFTLGSGTYRIGSSVEFDWCAVNAAQTAKKLGHTTLMLNCNPETVSTDYDTCDRLYFDEISLERVLDIVAFEEPNGVIVSVGGQTANNLATGLAKEGVYLYGTSAEMIDQAENRHLFSKLLDSIEVDQPPWKELTNVHEAKRFAKAVQYPVLVRPSYVLSGAAMNVARNARELDEYLKLAIDVSREHPVVITKFIENSKEIEIDAVAKDGKILIYAISEHVENAGVHSGDATSVLPPMRLYLETVHRIKKISAKIAESLNITGPFNIQFLAYRNHVQVIECNLRASRSFPFCSKVFKHNMIDLAARAMLGAELPQIDKRALDIDHVGVKAPQFSFSRLKGADPISGVEMASTGEVGCLGSNLHDAFLKALQSTGFTVPKKNIYFSADRIEDRVAFLESAHKLVKLGYALHTDEHMLPLLREKKIRARQLVLHDVPEHELTRQSIDLVITIAVPNGKASHADSFRIRRAAVDLEIPLVTNVQIAILLVESLAYTAKHEPEIRAWSEY